MTISHRKIIVRDFIKDIVGIQFDAPPDWQNNEYIDFNDFTLDFCEEHWDLSFFPNEYKPYFGPVPYNRHLADIIDDSHFRRHAPSDLTPARYAARKKAENAVKQPR